ncbi:hypothetical protein B0H10DRAFT_2238680 [Mycena sp. CBHHK59/15]|nr:hypothetical protein B0H10DRAFT_2238680 [Mycena sp. CBHHK59/15]
MSVFPSTIRHVPIAIPYIREPSNLPVFGFHPVEDCHLGVPEIPRPYTHLKAPKDKVDNHQFTSYHRGDLTLRYTYEMVDEYNLGGELVPLPIVVHVYRRDFHLLWSEIKGYLRDGTIPSRYGAAITADGVVHAPMNEDNFRKLVRRFNLVLTCGGTKEWLFERSSRVKRAVVQQYHSEFEGTLYRNVLWTYGRAAILAMTLEELASLVQQQTSTWHLDAIPRARAAQVDLRWNL